MFFIMGVSNKGKDMDFTQTTICENCSAFGRLEVFMTYSYLSLFFIPTFKWNKQYFVRTTCCNSLYKIDNQLGLDIERKIKTNIKPEELIPFKVNTHKSQTCGNCGNYVEPEFKYCPKCGGVL